MADIIKFPPSSQKNNNVEAFSPSTLQAIREMGLVGKATEKVVVDLQKAKRKREEGDKNQEEIVEEKKKQNETLKKTNSGFSSVVDSLRQMKASVLNYVALQKERRDYLKQQEFKDKMAANEAIAEKKQGVSLSDEQPKKEGEESKSNIMGSVIGFFSKLLTNPAILGALLAATWNLLPDDIKDLVGGFMDGLTGVDNVMGKFIGGVEMFLAVVAAWQAYKLGRAFRGFGKGITMLGGRLATSRTTRRSAIRLTGRAGARRMSSGISILSRGTGAAFTGLGYGITAGGIYGAYKLGSHGYDMTQQTNIGKSLSGSQSGVADLIIQKFTAAGFTKTQAVAALANAVAESGLNPKAENVTSREASYGLFQMNVKGGLGTGYTPDQLKDPNFNIDLAIAAAKKARNFMGAKDDLAAAVEAFVREVERPQHPDRETSKRVGIAMNLAKKYGVGPQSSASVPSAPLPPPDTPSATKHKGASLSSQPPPFQQATASSDNTNIGRGTGGAVTGNMMTGTGERSLLSVLENKAGQAIQIDNLSRNTQALEEERAKPIVEVAFVDTSTTINAAVSTNEVYFGGTVSDRQYAYGSA